MAEEQAGEKYMYHNHLGVFVAKDLNRDLQELEPRRMKNDTFYQL